jgi:hypothetical protein
MFGDGPESPIGQNIAAATPKLFVHALPIPLLNVVVLRVLFVSG